MLIASCKEISNLFYPASVLSKRASGTTTLVELAFGLACFSSDQKCTVGLQLTHGTHHPVHGAVVCSINSPHYTENTERQGLQENSTVISGVHYELRL